MEVNELVKFSFNKKNEQEIVKYYAEYGYVIIKNMIPEKKINKYLGSIDKVLDRKFTSFWRTQDTHRYIPLRKNNNGLLENSLGNPHALCWSSDVRNSVINIVASNIVREVLECINGNSQFSLWQTMYFDKSTGTVGHQDSYYLDTIPNGSLVGAWYALEDINKDAGPFWIIPKSHKQLIYENDISKKRYADHDKFIKVMSEYLNDKKLNVDIKPMLLDKGDCLFWHPYLVHGALENSNPILSRKSLTAHYYPSDFSLKYHDKKVPGKKINDLPIKITGFPTPQGNAKAIAKAYINILKQLLNKDAIMDMRSKSYKNDNN